MADVFSGQGGQDFGPLDPLSSVSENVGITGARADGASDGIYGTVASSASDGSLSYTTTLTTSNLAQGESRTDSIYVSQQTGEISISGTIEVGDKYSLVVDGYPVSYTVTEEDVAGGMDLNGLSKAFVAAINEDEDIKDIVVASVGGQAGAISLSSIDLKPGQPFCGLGQCQKWR